MIDTIIFDADGVIVDTEDLWDLASTEFLGRRDVAYVRDDLKHLLTGRSVVEGVRVMQAMYGFGGDPESLAEERMAIVEGLLCRRAAFVRGFPEFFASVRDRYKTCVATAMPVRLLAVVDRCLGLEGLFDGRVYSVQGAGCRSKPHPDIFLLAADLLGSLPETCLVIEDAPYGIAAAKAAGMACVALTTTYGPDRLMGADRIASSFAEIDLASL
jgi:beta-phosphoglucomutase-like phosphatase (HAD superfamily)